MLKIGDKVRVRRLKDLVNEFGMKGGVRFDRSIECGQYANFIESMFKFCGGIYQVTRLNGQYITLDGAGWYTYTTNMLEDPETGAPVEAPEYDVEDYEPPLPF